jgi:hypothetical protein
VERTSVNGRSARLSGLLFWALAVAAAALLLALTGFESRDPDSTVYAEISARLSRVPVFTWLTPDWGGSWGLTGPFREHPVGIFVPPALLARWGYPPEQAAFVIGVLYSVASLWMLQRLVAPFVPHYEAVAVQWTALILPIAFVYRVRATQEYPTLLLLLGALYATHRSRRSPAWIAGLAAAACALALVKGIFVIFVPIVCSLWILCMPDGAAEHRAATRRDAVAWTGLALTVVVVAAGTWAYELAYQRATGNSILSYYLRSRVGENAGLTAGAFSLSAKAYNVVWYAARVLWFAMPGSLALLLNAPRLRYASAGARRSMAFALLTAALYVAAMSLGANKADRFIFPAYFSVGTVGAVVAVRRWDWAHRLATRLAASPPYVLPLVWLGLFMLGLATEHRLPRVKLWTS